MKKALIITGKMVQDHEYIYPYYRLLEEGYILDVATNNKEEVTGQIGVRVIPSIDIANLKAEDYEIIAIPGGAKCMEYLRQDKRVINFIVDFFNSGKVIASICHAAQILISAKIVKGREIAGYYSLKDDIENAGAIYVDRPCVISDNIVTTAHYKDMGAWMRGAIELAKKKRN